MSTGCHTLYCHCAYAKVVPPAVKAEVLTQLTERGIAFEAVPDLCEMSARRDPRLKELAALAGDGASVAIAACYPRAVKWLFSAADAPLPDQHVTVANMRTDTAEAVLATLLNAPPQDASADAIVQAQAPAQAQAQPAPDAASPTPSPTPPSAPAPIAASAALADVAAVPVQILRKPVPTAAELEVPAPSGWKPWFPVIDYTRCTNCMQCLSFCLFDVYGVSDDKKIQVQNQSNCKTDCPACSRVCPEVAIMFPKYRHSPINGDEVNSDDVRREAMKVDISALLGGDIYSALRDRSAKAKSRFSKERDEDRALTERQNCLIKLQQQMAIDIPPEVFAALPGPDEIRAKAEAAAARAQEALRSRSTPTPAES